MLNKVLLIGYSGTVAEEHRCLAAYRYEIPEEGKDLYLFSQLDCPDADLSLQAPCTAGFLWTFRNDVFTRRFGIQWHILPATLLLVFGYFAQPFIDIRKVKPASVAIEQIKGDTGEPTENIEKATTEKDVE